MLNNLPLEIKLIIAEYDHEVWHKLSQVDKIFGLYSLDNKVQDKIKKKFRKKVEHIVSFFGGEFKYVENMHYILPNNSKHGEYIAYYNTMRDIKLICNYYNGYLHGKYILYDRMGNTLIDANYEKGNLHGMFKKCYENYGNCSTSMRRCEPTQHSIKKEVTYDDGIKIGKESKYYRNGNIKKEVTYDNGIKTGKEYKYYNNGNIKKEISYGDYSIIKYHKEYYENGNPYFIRYYDLGIYKEYYENIKDSLNTNDKQLIYKYIEFNGNNKNGKYIKYYRNGNLNVSAFYRNDLLDGRYTKLYNDGKPRIKCIYNKGVINGIYKSYYDNGQLHCIKKHRQDGGVEYVLIYNTKGLLIKEVRSKNK